ncbi:MAG: hypothetical protein ACREAK_11575 [Nitrosarchaeum sp.]
MSFLPQRSKPSYRLQTDKIEPIVWEKMKSRQKRNVTTPQQKADILMEIISERLDVSTGEILKITNWSEVTLDRVRKYVIDLFPEQFAYKKRIFSAIGFNRNHLISEREEIKND